MRTFTVDWRHISVGLAGVLLLIFLLWKTTLGGSEPKPTVSAPVGTKPIAASPDSP